MSEFPSPHLNTNSRKVRILVFFFSPYLISALMSSWSQADTQYPLKEGCQGLAKHKADVTFQEFHAYIDFNP